MMPRRSIEKVKRDLYKLLHNAERTRKRTGNSEDRDIAMLIESILPLFDMDMMWDERENLK